jgi:hypothetical protein
MGNVPRGVEESAKKDKKLRMILCERGEFR